MPCTLNVSQVRQALYHASADIGVGTASTANLGRWFHEQFSQLVGNGSCPGLLAELADVEADLETWKRTLVAASYKHAVGPRLTRETASLHDCVPQVLGWWQATQAACHWLAELCWSLRAQTAVQRKGGARPWLTLSEYFTTEESFACELHAPGWSDSVRLVGTADAVIRLAATGAWCVLEFKLGQTSPEADLGQACLYHLLISETQRANGRALDHGSLALVSFRPERHERVFSAADLDTARERLIELIGKLAGVAQPQNASPPTAAHATDIPSAAPTMATARRRSFETTPTEAHLELGRGLIRTFSEYGVAVSLEESIVAGPTFLRFPLRLGRGTKVSAVRRLAPELQVRLQLTEKPFINNEGGQLVVDVQRPDRQLVYFSDVRHELPQPDSRLGGSHVPIGVDLMGQLVCADLNQTAHAHLLAAGTTGSGKSEWLRLALAGLLLTNTPDTMRLLIIDPKRNAFHALRASPFLWRPLVFPDKQSAGDVLAELAEEMDRRYRIGNGADNFAQLALQSTEKLPRIVCVCDEYRDLISRDKQERKQIETQICRLGAKARAAGIHLILATQEPSRDTIKGPLDSNIPARVGFKMGKALESKMLLNQDGAENLLGHGDLLFKEIGTPSRLQAPLLTEADRLEIFGGVRPSDEHRAGSDKA